MLADHEGMRLVMTWLLGVPLMVCGMVLAHAALVTQPPVAEVRPLVAEVRPLLVHERSCAGQDEQHGVRPAVTQQRHMLACDPLAIED